MAPSDPGKSRLAALHPKAYLLVHALAGVLVTAALLWAFASIADAVADKGRVAGADLALTQWIQLHDTEWGEKLFAFVSLLGSSVLVAIIAIASAFYASRRDWLRAGALALGSATGAGLNMLLKHLFHRGRPEFATEFITHASWSFPSGHAMDSIVGYGILLAVLLERVSTPARRRALVAAITLLIVAIGVSRVYLGVHYLTDVVAGWLAGGAWLFVCITAFHFAERRRGRIMDARRAPTQ